MSEHFCTEHNVAFKHFEKDGKEWYAHPTDDPAYPKGWCNEKKKSSQPAQDKPALGTYAHPSGGMISILSDAQIRMKCLKQAHDVYSVKSPDEISSDGILALARKYEEYIKNG